MLLLAIEDRNSSGVFLVASFDAARMLPHNSWSHCPYASHAGHVETSAGTNAPIALLRTIKAMEGASTNISGNGLSGA